MIISYLKVSFNSFRANFGFRMLVFASFSIFLSFLLKLLTFPATIKHIIKLVIIKSMLTSSMFIINLAPRCWLVWI